MNENVSLFNRVVVGCTVAMVAMTMLSGWWHQSSELSSGQSDSLADKYADIEVLAGPSVGDGGGGG